MCYDKIEKYKNYVVRERCILTFLLIGELILWLSLTVLLIWNFNIALLAISFVCLIAAFISVSVLIRCNRLLKGLSSIAENKVINRTYDVFFYQPKIAYLVIPTFSKNYYNTKYYGIEIIGSDKKRYYYFFDQPLNWSKENLNKLQERFKSDITVQCYKNTNIIRTVENNPYYIKLYYGNVR